jgi:predicted amidohydrolase
MSKYNKTLLLSIPKGIKGDYYKQHLKPVDEDEKNYFFLQVEAKPITYMWRLWHTD